MACAACVAAEDSCRGFGSSSLVSGSASRRCLLSPQNALCWKADRLPLVEVESAQRPAFDPPVLLQLESSRAGDTAVTHRGLARAASTLCPCRGQANLAGRISGEFIYLFPFYCLHKMAWKLKELIISLSILFFSFSTWLNLALIAHLFIGFKWCTAVNYCPNGWEWMIEKVVAKQHAKE